jgi:glycosyltransferase involved in cell wall biosynthesis
VIRLDSTVNQPYLAVIGRIEPLKNQIGLIRSGIDGLVRVVFAGAPNPERRLYAARFRRLTRARSRLTRLGQLDRAGAAVLANAVAHLLPSHRENFGLVTLEALSAGCEAIIPAHHLAATELAGAVHTYAPNDPESLLSVVRQIQAGKRLAQRFVADRHTISAVCDQLLKLYADGS